MYPDAPGGIDSFKIGGDYQDFVADILYKRYGWRIDYFTRMQEQYEYGESRQGVEVKHDPHTKYRHLSIETEEKSRLAVPIWTPSGIFRDDNTIWYIQGDENSFYIFLKRDLQEWYNLKSPRVTEMNKTMRRFFLEYQDANILGIKISCIF